MSETVQASRYPQARIDRLVGLVFVLVSVGVIALVGFAEQQILSSFQPLENQHLFVLTTLWVLAYGALSAVIADSIVPILDGAVTTDEPALVVFAVLNVGLSIAWFVLLASTSFRSVMYGVSVVGFVISGVGLFFVDTRYAVYFAIMCFWFLVVSGLAVAQWVLSSGTLGL